MPTFEYQAQSASGAIESGLVEGATLDGVVQDLASKGLKVTQIGFSTPGSAPSFAGPPQAQAPYGYERSAPVQEQGRGPQFNLPPDLQQRSYLATSVWGPLVGQVPLTDLSFFFRQAATMFRAGVGMSQSLNTLASQGRNPKLTGIVREMSRAVDQGLPMSVVMQRYPEVFSGVMLSVLRAGEEGGFLDQALTTISDYIDQEVELRNLYRRVTFWPKLEIAASIVVILAANAIIAAVGRPGSMTLSSPLTTLTTWYVLGPLIVIIFLFLRVGLANPRIRYNWDAFLVTVPYAGETLRYLAMAKFGRAFSALHQAGVPMERSLRMSADACGNEYLRAKIYPASRRLQEGEGITETFASTQAFSPIVMDMVRTGEMTGEVDKMLTRSSDFYIEESKVRQHQLATVVGVFVMFLVACYIGYLVITFWMQYSSGLASAGGAG